MTDDRTRQARKAAERPEMRIISRAGEELASDALSVAGYEKWGCNDYSVVEVTESDDPTLLATGNELENRSYVVLSPRDLVRIKPRDRKDHVQWLVDKGRYEEALTEVEKIEAEEAALGVRLPVTSENGKGVDDNRTTNARSHLTSQEIGQMFIEHLVREGLLISH